MGGASGRSSRGGFKSPFRRKKSGSAEAPSVTVPDATVKSKSSGESSSRPPIAALPRKPIATQGRPGHSGSGQSYDNDSSNTGKRKKRRFGFGHEGLDGIVVDILGEID